MEDKRINLHMDQKRALFIMLSFAFFMFGIGFLTVLSVGKDFSQLSSLLRSDYEYSALSKEEAIQDDYIQFDAGISFSITPDALSTINAVILMQSSNSQYTKSIDWNTGKLNTYSIAITRGLARQYGLNVGNKLYSKHIVDGTDCSYIIESLLPDISSIRTVNGGTFTDGIIIMGYDDRYADNLLYSNIIYTKVPIEELATSTINTPVDIIYRTDEILAVIKKIIPYLLLFLLLSILITYNLVSAYIRDIKYNLKRMIMLGFNKKGLDTSLRKLIFRMSFLSISVSFILTMVVAIIFGFSIAEGLYVLVELGTEIITALITTNAFIRQLWR